MASHHPAHVQIVEQFTAPRNSNAIIYSLLGIGVVLFLLGLLFPFPATHGAGDHGSAGAAVTLVAQHEGEATTHDSTHTDSAAHAAPHGAAADHAAGAAHPAAADHGAEAGGHHAAPTQGQRIWANLLICGFMFTGVGLMSLFFLAVSYVTDAGWMSVIRRVAEGMSFMLPVGVVVMLLVVFVGAPYLYHHWWPTAGHNPLVEDPILAKKTWWLGVPKFYLRTLVYAVLWLGFWWWIRRVSLAEDKATTDMRGRLVRVAAPFVIVFALSWSAASWDWVMSLEPHWFSTMFGVYTFASIFVTTLALLTICSVYLKANGLLPVFNNSHLHDLGKFVFAFSIFWTYIWFCQFLLIWYANIPEETQYFVDRLGQFNKYDGPYVGYFFGGFVICFVVPFFGLMTAGSKRIAYYLSIVALVLVLGHWIDISQMVLPGVLGPYGGFGFIELGLFVFFLGLFFLVTRYGLAQAPLIARNDRYLKESILHEYH